MSIRAAIWTVIIVFGLSLAGSIVFLLSGRADLLSRVVGSHTGTDTRIYNRTVLSNEAVYLKISRDRTFIVTHPLGSASGRVETTDDTLILNFTRINGRPVADWSRDWPKRREDLVRQTMATLATGPRPAFPLNQELKDAKDVADAIQRVERQRPAEVADPFGTPWQYEVRGRTLHSIGGGQPEFN